MRLFSPLTHIQKVNAAKEQAAQLSRRIAALLQHVTDWLRSGSDPIGEDVRGCLEELLRYVLSSKFSLPRISHASVDTVNFSLFAAIRDEVKRQLDNSWLYRLLHYASMASMLAQHTQHLEDAWHAFDVSAVGTRHIPTWS